jgi:hypothetical protein
MHNSICRQSWYFRVGLAAAAALPLVGSASPAFFDGTEFLGDPIGTDIAPGSDFVLAGVGLKVGQPGTINLTVPNGVAIKQVLAYWEGLAKTATEQGDTDTVTIGGVQVTGTRIGGPTQWVHSDARFTSSYRADITAENLVVNGANSIQVSGLDFYLSNSGMSLLVVISDGTTSTRLQVRDGNDTAYFDWPSPLDTTVPVTYNFTPSVADRPASLGFVAGSVGPFPTIIEISFDGVPAIHLNDALGNLDGPEWDSLVYDLSVPAGVSSVTAQVLSADSGVGQYNDAKPASLVWVVSTFRLEKDIPPPPPGGEGCTPGYWKNHPDSWGPTGYSPTDVFDQIFNVSAFGSKTLEEVLRTGGGGLIALGRSAVAALLSAAHPDVDYDLTEAQVLTLVHDAIVSGDADKIERLKNYLDELNNAGCPLN